MFIIKFKGSFDDIEVSDEQGQAIIRDMKQKNLPDKIELNGGIYDSKSIKAVQPSGGSRASGNNEKTKKNQEKIDVEYNASRERSLALAPEERAKDLNILTLVWYAETGENLNPEDIPADVAKEVIIRQTAFFKEHPKRMYALPTIYRDLLPKKREASGSKEYKTLASEARAGTMIVVERLIGADIGQSLK